MDNNVEKLNHYPAMVSFIEYGKLAERLKEGYVLNEEDITLLHTVIDNAVFWKDKYASLRHKIQELDENEIVRL